MLFTVIYVNSYCLHFLSPCLFLSVCFHAVKGIRLESTSINNLKDLKVNRCYSHFRLRCIVWDLSRSFLLRLAISIFTVILIYTMAQVNTFTCSVDSCNDQAREKCESIGNCHRWVPFPVFFSHHLIYVGCISNSLDSAQPLKQARRNYGDSFI